MDGILRQNTAVDILLGAFVDKTDGDTAETALTILQAGVRLSKNGQNMAQKNDDTTCVHDEEGMYNCELDATDTDTVGILTVVSHPTGALLVKQSYQVLDEVAFDTLYAVAATVLTALDTGLLIKSTVSTVNSPTSYDIAASLASDDILINNVIGFEDAGNSANLHTTWITDIDQANNRVIINDAPLNWTIAATDIVRLTDQPHPQPHAVIAVGAAALAKAANLEGFFQLAVREDAAIAADLSGLLATLNADLGSGGGLYDNVTDSLEANEAQIAAVFSTQMAESYAADGVAPTPAQSLFLIQQLLSEFAIAGVTLTVKKLDGVTVAATLTLDDAVNPTSATRAS